MRALLKEFIFFLKTEPKWWIVPAMVALVLIGILLGQTGSEPRFEM